ncbi:MAG: SDR family oxidoreductase [Nitrososphaeria archaeon]|jgi:3-oxoacyl-[acyl-carrier protein] reductase
MSRKKNDKTNFISLAELVSLRGKRALITGSGIGKAMAYRFAEAGASLQLVDIKEESLVVMKEELEQFSTDISVHKVNLSKKEEIDSLWKELEGKEPDILVNNAGIYPTKSFLDVDEAFLEKVMDINLNTVFWMCQHMIKSRLKMGGVIINMGSIEAIMPFKEDMCHYDISKAGIMVLSRALASEYGKHGFRINVLVPGGIWTQGTKNLAKEAIKFKPNIIKSGIEYNMKTPFGRLGKPDEIARMALVLATDLSSYVNGTLIAVDGGFLSA